jgi:hypothetical protein
MILRPKTLKIYNPERLLSMATAQAEIRFDAAAELLANTVKANLRTIIGKHSVGGDSYYYSKGVNRDVYGRGKNKGKWWTARSVGSLLYSVRIIKKNKLGGEPNIWVMVGNKKAYWAAMFEYATQAERGQPYWRPAISKSKPAMINIWEKGA